MPSNAAQEARLYVDQSMPEPDQWEFCRGQVSIFSDRCPDKTTPNEDAVALIPCGDDSGVLAVADGLGGVPAGDKAASLALNEIRQAVEAIDKNQMLLRTAILNGIENANQRVQQLAVGAATTLAAVEINGDTIRPYHVGDSLILLVGNRGKIKLQTVPHSPVGYGIEAGLLDEDEAMHHEDRHLVSNVIGGASMRIEIGPVIPLRARDSLLLASDGLADNLQIGEIVERIRKGPMLPAARKMVADARQRMLGEKSGQPSKPDDLSFVLFRRRS